MRLFRLIVHLCFQIMYVGCGGSHTGAVTTEGHLYMWGCADNGRLGMRGSLFAYFKSRMGVLQPCCCRVPVGVSGSVLEPMLVESFVEKGIRIASVRTWSAGVCVCV